MSRRRNGGRARTKVRHRTLTPAELEHAKATLQEATQAQLRGDVPTAASKHLELWGQGQEGAAAYYHGFIAYRRKRNYAEAEKCFRHAIMRGVDTAHAWHNLGCVLRDQARLEEAQVCFLKSLERDDRMVESLSGYASVTYELGESEAAQAAWARVFTLAPEVTDPAQRYDLAIQYLTFGDYATGWDWHQARWDAVLFQSEHQRPEGPAWDGQPIRTLLLHAEQGHGDAIMLLRWLPWVLERAQRVHLAIHTGLIPLVRRDYPEVLVQRLDGDPLPPYDAHAALFDLPHLAGVATPEDVPPAPYLTAEPAHVPASKYRVGLVWAGGRDTHHDWRRSIPFETIAPLLDVPGICWHIMQRDRLEAFDASGLRTSVWHRDVGPWRDWGDTARALMALNLLVTVDTGIAHLAGALGVPTWLLLPRMPDYRWGLRGDATPWYGSMRLYRQRKALDWRDTVADVVADLTHWRAS